MIRKNQPFLNFLNIASDFILISLSYPMAMYIRLELLGGHSQMPLLSPPYYFMAGCCAILTVFVAAQALPQFRALCLTDIADGVDPHLGVLPDILQILLCQVAVADDGNILLVIALAAVITEDSPT